MVRAVFFVLLVSIGNVQADNLRLSGWGGIYGEVYDRLILRPFEAARGVQIAHDASPEGRTGADVREVTLREAVRGCDNGEYMWLSPSILEHLGSVSDYVPHAVQPCALAQWSWATVVAYSAGRFPNDSHQPSLISDFFNTKDFPGKRALKRSPHVIAAWALNAGGIPAGEVWEVLGRPDPAWLLVMKQLRPIEHDIIWVESDEEAIALLRDGTATLAMLNSSDLIRESVETVPDLRVMWDAAVVDLSMLVIPVNASNPQASMEFMRFVSESGNSLQFAATLGFGPVKFDTSRLINRDYRQYLPVDRSNFSNIIWGDVLWTQSLEGLELVERFAEWSESVSSIQSLAMIDPAEIADPVSDFLKQFDHNAIDTQGVNF